MEKRFVDGDVCLYGDRQVVIIGEPNEGRQTAQITDYPFKEDWQVQIEIRPLRDLGMVLWNRFNEKEVETVSENTFHSSLDKRKNGKLKLELLETGFPNAMMALAEVMTWAAEYKGYLPNDWKDLPDAKNGFLAAAARHRLKRLSGQEYDDESNLHHLYHEAFNVMAQLELLITGKLK